MGLKVQPQTGFLVSLVKDKKRQENNGPDMEIVRDTEMFWIENYTTNFNTTTTMVTDLWAGFEHVMAEK